MKTRPFASRLSTLPVVSELAERLSPENLDGRTPTQWLRRSVTRFAAAAWMRAMRLPATNRADLYDNRFGLRIATFHETPRSNLDRFKRFVEAFAKRWEIIGPTDVDEFRSLDGSKDRMLLTFDDGFENNHAAASWLATQGIAGIFFVVPEFVGRSVDEMQRALADRGLAAKPIHPDGSQRAMSRDQLDDLMAMGHRVAAHNTCHRDLGALESDRDIDIEIGEVVAKISEWSKRPCRDFAYAWGREDNVTSVSASKLADTGCRIYTSVRGLNIYGGSGQLLWRNAVQLSEPLPFVLAGLEGGMDHRVVGARQTLQSLFASSLDLT